MVAGFSGVAALASMKGISKPQEFRPFGYLSESRPKNLLWDKASLLGIDLGFAMNKRPAECQTKENK